MCVVIIRRSSFNPQFGVAEPFTAVISIKFNFVLYIHIHDFATTWLWTKFSGSRHCRRLNHFLLPQTQLRTASLLSVDQCDSLGSCFSFPGSFSCPEASDLNERLISIMTANSRCSAAEPPGLETQRREIESLLRQCELRAGDSW